MRHGDVYMKNVNRLHRETMPALAVKGPCAWIACLRGARIPLRRRQAAVAALLRNDVSFFRHCEKTVLARSDEIACASASTQHCCFGRLYDEAVYGSGGSGLPQSLRSFAMTRKERLFAMTMLAVIVVLCLMPAPVKAQDYTSNLVSHWRMDETSGTTASDSWQQ